MVEGYFFECLWTILHLLVKWLKGRKHPGNIVLTKIQPKNTRTTIIQTTDAHTDT